MAVSDRNDSVTDARKVQGAVSKPGNIGGPNYRDVNALRTRLAAISATTYTPAQLNLMTVNDMVYAVRLADDAGGVK